MTALIIFLLLIFIYPLVEWIWFDREEAEERIKKDEKYSFKKMNSEINRRQNEDRNE